MTLQRDERLASVRPIGVTDTREIERAGQAAGASGRVIAGNLDPLISMAAQGARAQAVERGVVRAGRVQFEMKDGMPVMPEDLPGAGSFFHANEGYRAALVARYLSESRIAASQRMGELARTHATDPDAFEAAARAQVEGWSSAAPEALRAELAPIYLTEAARVHARLAEARMTREVAASARLSAQAHGLNVSEVQMAVERGEDPSPALRRGEEFLSRQVQLGVLTAADAEMQRRELQVARIAGGVLAEARRRGYAGGNAYLERFERGEIAPGELSVEERRQVGELARARLNVARAVEDYTRVEGTRRAVTEVEAMVLSGQLDMARLRELERVVPGITERAEMALHRRGSLMASTWVQEYRIAAAREAEGAARRETVVENPSGPLGSLIDPNAPREVQDAQAQAVLRERGAQLQERAAQAKAASEAEKERAKADAERMIREGRIDEARMEQIEAIIPGTWTRVESGIASRGERAATAWRQGVSVARGRAIEQAMIEAILGGEPLTGGLPPSQIDEGAPLAVQAAQAAELAKRYEEAQKERAAAAERLEKMLMHALPGMTPADHNANNLAVASEIALRANGGVVPDYATPRGLRAGMIASMTGVMPPEMRAYIQGGAQSDDPEAFMAAARAYAAGRRSEHPNVRAAFDRLDPLTKKMLDGVEADISMVGAPPLAVMEERRQAAAGRSTSLDDAEKRLGDTAAKQRAALDAAIDQQIPRLVSWFARNMPWGEGAPEVSEHVRDLMRRAILFDMAFNNRSLEASAASVIDNFATTGTWARDERGNVIESVPFMRFGVSRLGVNDIGQVASERARLVSDPPEVVLAAPYRNASSTLAWVVPHVRQEAERRGIELPSGMSLDTVRLRPVYEGGQRQWQVWYRHGTVTTYVAEKGTAVPALFDLEARRAELIRGDAAADAAVERERAARERRNLNPADAPSMGVAP
jgi:hypothetical protein